MKPAVPVTATPTGVRVELRVLPRAPRNAIDGVRDGRIVVRVTAPPVDRAANTGVVALLAERLRVSKSSVRIVAGETARHKTVEIDGVTDRAVLDLL